MGRVRTKTVKRASRLVIERHYTRLTNDFHVNKKVVNEVATPSTKRLRNKIAGYITHLMKRIQKGPVRGISFKLQEEERERKDNYVPDVSALHTEDLIIDDVTSNLLKSIGMSLTQVKVRDMHTKVSRDKKAQGNIVGATFVHRQDPNRPRRPRPAQRQ